MADVSQTAANVAAVNNVKYYDGIGGATLTAGTPCYVDTSDSNKIKACDANALATANCKGVLMHPTAANQPARLAIEGTIDPGATLATGQWYGVSETAGGIAPLADILGSVNNPYTTVLGYGNADGDLVLNIVATGIALP